MITSGQTLIAVKDLRLHYNNRTIFENLNFEVVMGQHIGIVGQNGAGKSSLLKILSGGSNYDYGEVIVTRDTKVEHLAQDFKVDNDLTATAFLHSKTNHIRRMLTEYNEYPTQELHDKIQYLDGFNLEITSRKLLSLFNIADLDRPLSQMSGGEQRRVYLVGSIIGKPDLLLLDEPTNHLDIGSIAALEKYLQSYRGAIITISHDRFFLDNVVDSMWELSDSGIFTHPGNYSRYLQSKTARQANEQVADWKLRQYLKRELEWVNSGVKARGTKDKGRMQRYEQTKASQQTSKEDKLNLILPEIVPLGSKILDVENFNLYQQDQMLVKDFTFEFQPWHKIGLVGNNGSGKTTFLNSLLGRQKNPSLQFTGTIKTGQNTHFLYLDQHKEDLNHDLTPLEYISEGREKIPFGSGQISARKYLENWLFEKQKYQTPIQFLSGGEKSRLVLAKKLTEPCNFLVLDEPTNDLDLDTIRILEQALLDFPAPVIVVSHDRSFLNRVCNNIFGFDRSGTIKIATGNYDDFLERYPHTFCAKVNGSFNFSKSNQTSYNQKYSGKTSVNHKEERRKKAEAVRIEKEIARIEARTAFMKTQFDDPDFYSDMPKVSKTHQELEKLEKELEKLMNQWLILDS